MSLAFLITAFVTIGPQDTQTQAGNLAAVTVSGCLAQAARTGSSTDDAGIGTTATPNTAGVEANSGDPVNAYVLLDATPITTRSEDRRDRRTTYGLQGREFELAGHRGHRIEVCRPPPTISSAPNHKREDARRGYPADSCGVHQNVEHSCCATP